VVREGSTERDVEMARVRAKEDEAAMRERELDM
jgi:hypothetical protein